MSKPSFPLYRNESGIPLNRRVVMKAAAGLSAMLAAGDALHTPAERPVASAQEADGTRSRSWAEAENINTDIKLEGEGWVTLLAEFPFWAVGFGWDTGAGTDATVEFQVSYDAETWTDLERIGVHGDGGPAATDDRHHTPLYFADGQEYLRYRTLDANGNLVVLDRFQVTYIDPTDGPWEPDRGRTMMRTSSVNTDTNVPPTIITRAQWGANENHRYGNMGEIWPPEYQTVQHAIVHHAAVNYGSDGYNAVRSIYYYHAVTQGWGDIGYNYVVDVRGNIFEGRVGGANVIGGHAYQFAVGSSGICVMGDFSSVNAPEAAKAALANIIAYVTRDLNPYGTAGFHEVPALPTICGHRDVVQSTCPGNGLYSALPWIRDTVAATLDSGRLDSQMPGGLVPGDWVKVQTTDESALPMHAQPGTGQLIVDRIPFGQRVEVERGPVTDAAHNWYLVIYNNRQGWVPADYLVVSPPIVDPMDGYTYGQNVQIGNNVPVKSSPSTSAGTVSTQSGSWAFLLAGPYPAGGTTWFQVMVHGGISGWITVNQFTIAPVTAPAAQYPVNSTVQALRTAGLRVRPGFPQTVQATLSAGTRMTVSGDPVGVTGYVWYPVYAGTGIGGGWIDANNIATAPRAVSAVGDLYRVTETMNFRSAAGTWASIVGTLTAGATGTVIGGPTNANGYVWWQLRTSSGSTGWAAANWLVATGTTTTPPAPAPTDPAPAPAPGAKFAIGNTMRITEGLNMRSGASTGSGVVTVLPAGTTGTIIGGPSSGSGYTWWQVQTSRGTGWAVENWMVRTGGDAPAPAPQPTNPTPAPTGKFAIGNVARVTEALRLRSSASTGAGIVATMPAGTTGDVIGGPQSGSGYTWWQLRTRYGTGWAAESWLANQGGTSTPSPTPPSSGFSVGSGATVTEGLNMRSGASTGNGVIRVLPAGTRVTLLEGPASGSGYTWWRVSTPYGEGWVVQNWLRV